VLRILLRAISKKIKIFVFILKKKDGIERGAGLTSFMLALETIFVDLLKCRDMTVVILPLKPLGE
jgi:hypothetical protein